MPRSYLKLTILMLVFIFLLVQPIFGADDDNGKGFPKFKIENLDGDDIKGEDAFADADLILIDFFTYYCKPCKKMMPHIDRFMDEYGECGFKAILFNEDEPEGVPLAY